LPQAIGEEQLGRREANINSRRPSTFLPYSSPSSTGCRAMCTVLWAAGRARRIEPEARVVGFVAAGLSSGGWACTKASNSTSVGCSGRHRARDDHLGYFVVRLDHRRCQCRHQCARHECRLRARMLQHVGVVRLPSAACSRHGHQTGIHRAEEAHRPVVAVVHQQQHALFAPDANARSPAATRAHARQAGRRQGARSSMKAAFRRALCIARQQVLREVERVARGLDVVMTMSPCGIGRSAREVDASLWQQVQHQRAPLRHGGPVGAARWTDEPAAGRPCEAASPSIGMTRSISPFGCVWWRSGDVPHVHHVDREACRSSAGLKMRP